jgi:hypothetical protein
MSGQPPRPRLRLIATGAPDSEPRTTRELYLRVAATIEVEPDPVATMAFEDWHTRFPDTPPPINQPGRSPWAVLFECLAGNALALGAGALIIALFRHF